LIDASIYDARNDRSSLLSLRSSYKRELEKHPPITLLPLYQHPIMYFWPIVYTCLGSLVFLLPPRCSGLNQLKTSFKSTALVTLGIYFFSTWPMWMRNFVLTTQARGRVVFAY